jgi:very-short-patch-repair endonuclease
MTDSGGRDVDEGGRVEPSEIIGMLGGVARWNEIECLVTRAQVDAELAAGTITRLYRGTYALGDLDDVRRRAQAAAGTVSHLSAAMAHGWKVKHPPDKPTITLPRSRSLPPDDGLAVFWQDLGPRQAVRGLTRPVETVVGCARTYDFDVALCVADSALRAGAVTRARLLHAAETSPRTGRARAVRVVRAADGGSANPFESCARAIALDVPDLRVRAQVRIAGVGRVDLADLDLGIVVECESFEFHSDAASLRRDVRRYTACARRGLVVVRFTWDEVMFDPAYCRRALEDVVRLRLQQAVRRTW